MHTKWIAIALTLLAAPWAHAENAEDTTPRLEIREYRFQAHRNRGYERLVLEFTRKDSNTRVQPRVRTTGSEIRVERAILMGAIPESLINDSYSGKSRYLGPLSVNTDNPTAGFSLRAGLKNRQANLHAFWLANPPRLVIDASTRGLASEESAGGAHEEGVTVSRRRPRPPAFDKFICFPAGAQVGMNVIFQPRTNREEELKNIHLNLAGASGTGEDPTPAPDSIVCYPKSAQVIAQLAFETPAPKEPVDAPEPAPASRPISEGITTDEGDATLDPGPVTQPRVPAAAPKPAQIPAPPAAVPAEASKPSSPASLLPPLK